MKSIPFFLWGCIFFAFASLDSASDYKRAEIEFRKAWEILYPLPFARITKVDPLQKGVLKEKRKDQKEVFVYNFTIFMPKYRVESDQPIALEEGREILAFFFWEPKNGETPYRIRLGENEFVP